MGPPRAPPGRRRLRAPHGRLCVGDYANGRISAFRPSGEHVNWLDTGLGPNTLTGIAFGPEGRLFAVDRTNNRVVRIDPR